MNTVPYWDLKNEKLVRTFLFSDFKEAMSLRIASSRPTFLLFKS